MKYIVTLLLILASSASFAQSNNDAAFWQKAADAIANQRNNAMNSVALTEAKLTIATEELAKAQARIKELEEKDKK